MRLFIAINLDKQYIDQLQNSIYSLRAASRSGTFTDSQNLHLTLVFLGETEQTEKAVGVLNGVDFPFFTIWIEGLGKFSNAKGDLYWAGVRTNKMLMEMRNDLANGLKDKGFSLDTKPFLPHLTLGRNVILKEGTSQSELAKSMEAIAIEVRSVELMKSECLQGGLIYTPVYTRRLGGRI